MKKGSDMRLYMARKSGLDGRGRRMRPSLLLVLSAFILVFSLTFITSMEKGIADVIRLMGSGDIRVEGEYESALYHTDRVRNTEALAFSEDSSTGIYLKAVDISSYFTPERVAVMGLSADPVLIGKRGAILMSEEMTEELGLEVGDRLTVMYMEEEKERAVPVLATVAGTFSSGYDEFDRMLTFMDYERVRGPVCTEILLTDAETSPIVLSELRKEGYDASDWKTLYKGLYSNVELSVTLLYGVFFILAFLTAFFSSSISYDFLERDKKDAASLLLLGLERKALRRTYVGISFRVVAVSLAVGFLIAIPVSLLVPFIMKSVSALHFDMLSSYLLVFDISFPWLSLFGLFAFILFISWLMLHFTLRHWAGESIGELVKAE